MSKFGFGWAINSATILIVITITKIIMNIINNFDIKFIENFQAIWKKVKPGINDRLSKDK